MRYILSINQNLFDAIQHSDALKVLRWRVNTHINTALIWDVNVTDVYTSKGGV